MISGVIRFGFYKDIMQRIVILLNDHVRELFKVEPLLKGNDPDSVFIVKNMGEKVLVLKVIVVFKDSLHLSQNCASAICIRN